MSSSFSHFVPLDRHSVVVFEVPKIVRYLSFGLVWLCGSVGCLAKSCDSYGSFEE